MASFQQQRKQKASARSKKQAVAAAVTAEDAAEQAAPEDLGLQQTSSSGGQAAVTPKAAAIDALLQAAECHVNPFFYAQAPPAAGGGAAAGGRPAGDGGAVDASELKFLEESRDVTVVKLLIRAARWHLEGEPAAAAVGPAAGGLSVQGGSERWVDVPTLVRLNHALLVRFLAQRLADHKTALNEVRTTHSMQQAWTAIQQAWP